MRRKLAFLLVVSMLFGLVQPVSASEVNMKSYEEMDSLEDSEFIFEETENEVVSGNEALHFDDSLEPEENVEITAAAIATGVTGSVSNNNYLLGYTVYKGDTEEYAVITSFKDTTTQSSESPIHNITIPSYVEVEGKKIPVTQIADKVFKGKLTIHKVFFEEDAQLTTIGNQAFYGCERLNYLELPDSITSIGIKAFYQATDLGLQEVAEPMMDDSELLLPKGLISIGTKAFQECVNLEKVTIPVTLQEVIIDKGKDEAGPFYLCDNLEKITLLNGMESIPAHLFDGHILPTTTDDNGEYLQVLELEIPDSVKEIGEEAFRNQSNIAPKLELPESLTTIGHTAFENCLNLKEVYIPASLVKYNRAGGEEHGAFHNCISIEKVVFAEGLTIIPDFLFAEETDNPDVVNAYFDVMIPASVEKIGSRAFIRNRAIRSFQAEDGSKLTEIDIYAFAGCRHLETVILPESIKTIDDDAFQHCFALKSISIPESVTLIDVEAFQYCTGLEEVIFETNNLYTHTQEIKDRAFKGCTSLKRVQLGNKVKEIKGGTFNNCSSLVELEIPYGVTKMWKNIFTNCDALKYLYIPSSVATISTTKSELAYCYEQGLTIYVEKGESQAKIWAQNNGFKTETGIYVVKDEFPDANLQRQMMHEDFDKNLDTRLTLKEIEKVKEVKINDREIADLTGLQLFTALEKLECNDNALEQLNTSSFSELKELSCSNNHIVSFDFAKNTKLEKVSLGTQTKNIAVEELGNYDLYLLPLPEVNRISELSDVDVAGTLTEGVYWKTAYDVPDQLGYKYTVAFGSKQSAEADITIAVTNAGIVFSEREYPDNNLRQILQTLLDTNKNGLVSKDEERGRKSVNVDNQQIFDMTGISRMSALEELSCAGNDLSELDVSGNPKLISLDCSNNRIFSLKFAEQTNLKKLNVENNQLKSLDLSMTSELETLKCGGNQLAALNVDGNIPTTDYLTGKQEVTLAEIIEEDSHSVVIKEYDDTFDYLKVSDVKIYRKDGKEIKMDELPKVVEKGVILPEGTSKVTYSYSLGEQVIPMKVTVDVVDKLEEVVLVDIAKLQISSFSDKAYTGKSTKQNVEVYDGAYMLREGFDYDVIYQNNVEAGMATVQIIGKGKYYGTYVGNYKIISAWDVEVKNIPDQTFKNESIEPKLTVKFGKKTLLKERDYTVEYLNNFNVGVATVVITGAGEYAEKGMKEVTFNIRECKLSKASVKINTVTYNAAMQEPEAILVFNDIELKKGIDYEVSYNNNIKAGNGTMTLVGIGNYTGTVNKKFTIKKLDLNSLSDNSIMVDQTASFDMTGAKPNVVIRLDENTVLQEKADYTLSYKNNKKVGNMATLTIKGKGNCTGKVEKQFKVTPMSISNNSIDIEIAVAQKKEGRELVPSVSVVQGKKKLRQGENKDYIISYDKTKTTEKGSVTVNIIGKNNYEGEVTKQFVIVENLITKAKIKGLQNFVYDGEECIQDENEIQVMLGKEEVPAAAYNIIYQDNVKPGKAQMIVEADYLACDYEFGGSVKGNFTISPVKFVPAKNQERVTAIFESGDQDEAVFEYTGTQVCPDLIVTDTEFGKVLEEGVDYTLNYKNNINVGKNASVVVKGIGGYTGSISLKYEIVGKDMVEFENDFRVIIRNSAYSGKKITPRIIIMDQNKTLKLNKDYKLIVKPEIDDESFNGNVIQKGRYIVTIQGAGNYAGELVGYDFYVY